LTDLTDQENVNTVEKAHTHFDYDNRGLLTLKTDPLQKNTIYKYHADGTLWEKTDRNNNKITYTHTPTNKLDTITYPDASSVKFAYTVQDRLESMTDSLGTTNYTEYDSLGRLKSATDPNGFTVQYEYDTAQVENDQAGMLTKIIYPGNKTVTYTYDKLNRLETVTNWLSQSAVYEYDAAGRLDKFTNFNGTVTDYEYDGANRLINLTNVAGSTPIARYKFADLDGNGNPRQIQTQEPLIPVVNTGTDTYSYNPTKNRLESASSDSFTYDDEGRLATGYGASYTFDYEHRLTGIGSTVQYFYDGIGNRLKAVRDTATTYYIYDMNGNLIAEADANKNITGYYIYGAGLMAMVTPADQVYCYHFNALGSTVALTDASMNMVNKYAYTPFATIANMEETIPQPFKFVGRYGIMSESNGFYYMRARYYAPKVRRFISEDPIDYNGGDLNLYAYVGNNPMIFVDASGLAPQNPFPGLPSFSEAFPSSNYIAPITDIVVGVNEAGGAIALEILAVAGIVAAPALGPETLLLTVSAGPAGLEMGWDAYQRITSGIDRLSQNNGGGHGS
jgi:RHS repeat-associated protein